MKKLILIITPLLIVVGLHANSKKIDIENQNGTIVKGSTLHSYAKPGAPIDMEFNTTKVDINQTADVNISLLTTAQTGTLSVLLTLDDNLTTIESIDNNLTFKITPDSQKFLINFQVKSEENGLFYIKLLTRVDKGHGLKLRSFAVPVYVGEKPKKLIKIIPLSMKALNNGENISISKAIETIKVIKEK